MPQEIQRAQKKLQESGIFAVSPLLCGGDEIPLRRALDGQFVDIIGGGALVYWLHHVVP